MIPRAAARRPVPGLVIVPTSGGVDLPAWSPTPPPRGGWTPAAAFQASLDYVAALDSRNSGASTRRLVSGAYRDLLARLPGTKRAGIVERLRGVDHFGAYFGEPVGEVDEVDEEPPF